MATSVPPHNAAELLDAAILLIDQPKADDAAVLGHVKGPDFPTGGQIVDSPQAIAEAYATGRGPFRTRARWHVEDQGRGTWIAVVDQLPYAVQKGKFIEQNASLINEQKIPIIDDVPHEPHSAITTVIQSRTTPLQSLL